MSIDLVKKRYFVIVDSDGNYLKLNKSGTILKTVEKTYQGFMGSQAEIYRVYGVLLKRLSEGTLVGPKDNFSLGGVLEIVETVSQVSHISNDEITSFLSEFDCKDSLKTTGPEAIHVESNSVVKSNEDLDIYLDLSKRIYDDIIISDDEIIMDTFYRDSDDLIDFDFDDDVEFDIVCNCKNCSCGSSSKSKLTEEDYFIK